jgi:hypothetical protein
MNYLSEKYDVDVMVEGLKRTRKAMETEPLRSVLLGGEIYDNTIKHDPKSDEYLAEYVRKVSISIGSFGIDYGEKTRADALAKTDFSLLLSRRLSLSSLSF